MAIVRDVVSVVGPDAQKYLHSQLSQDIAAMRPGDRRWTFVLEPAGKVVALAEVRFVDSEFFELTTDAGYGEVLEARLRRFLIRVKAEITVRSSTSEGDDEAAESERVAAGWPAMGSEIIPGETIPAETGITQWAVSFTKGCYPGQELVERMDSRGAPARRDLRVLPAVGAAVGDAIVDPATGEEVGTVTSVAGDAAIGFVRRGHEVGAAPSGPPSEA